MLSRAFYFCQSFSPVVYPFSFSLSISLSSLSLLSSFFLFDKLLDFEIVTLNILRWQTGTKYLLRIKRLWLQMPYIPYNGLRYWKFDWWLFCVLLTFANFMLRLEILNVFGHGHILPMFLFEQHILCWIPYPWNASLSTKDIFQIAWNTKWASATTSTMGWAKFSDIVQYGQNEIYCTECVQTLLILFGL